MASGILPYMWSATSCSATGSSKTGTVEYNVYHIGNIVIGFLIVPITATMSQANDIIVTGLPGAKFPIQLPLICVGGNNSGKTGRCRIERNGSVITWYTPVTPTNGETYLIPLSYVTS